jgi:hypothetical protein
MKRKPQLRILRMFNGMCSTKARVQARRRIRAGRSEKSHVVMYSRKAERVEEEGPASIVPFEVCRKEREKTMLFAFLGPSFSCYVSSLALDSTKYDHEQ